MDIVKGLELILHDTDEGAYFDSKWTLEAICNILDNAVKYTNEGSTFSAFLPKSA